MIATAGAALFAVAAIVFAFFNPDLTDRTLRSIVIAVVTLVFLAGAWALARRRLQFSAEAVGGLGLVFLGLDVHSLSQHATALHPWASAALGTAVVGTVMLFAALRARIRIWLWAALLGLAAVPGMLGLAVPGGFATALGFALSAFAATGLCAWTPRLSARFAEKSDAGPARLRAEVVTLTALQLLATASAVGAVLPGGEALPSALILALLAGNAVLAARHLLPRTWAVIAGVLTVAAGAIAARAVAPVFGRGSKDTSPWRAGEPPSPSSSVLSCPSRRARPGAPRRRCSDRARGRQRAFAHDRSVHRRRAHEHAHRPDGR
ncbi:hypothetical protein [Microbacterium sp. NIBRBAC000506063]|uniref:hypothetical protein n=1 Tax=Microbacterium sp. NIBRBAC000506063 TaxID=2734618 RepID=UPI001BB51244|nr:hypothetical protein [Microbacterium sp. NIBRBAC000506063]QTV79192.1 hypothetical protein KAE78_08970 [Microbacterium sp. NIBRBAC000506063]